MFLLDSDDDDNKNSEFFYELKFHRKYIETIITSFLLLNISNEIHLYTSQSNKTLLLNKNFWIYKKYFANIT